MPAEDKKRFRPWATKCGLAVSPVVCDASRRAREELYQLTPEQVFREKWPSTGHALHDEIVEVAIQEIGRRIKESAIADFGSGRQAAGESGARLHGELMDGDGLSVVLDGQVATYSDNPLEIVDWTLPVEPEDDIEKAIDLVVEMIVLAMTRRIERKRDDVFDGDKVFSPIAEPTGVRKRQYR